MAKKTKKPVKSGVRNRIKELVEVRAGDLVAHPKNWRTHPAKQRAAVAGILAEIGYASPLIARRDADGVLHLIDGHLRADLNPEQLVPVVVLDVSESEGDKLLLTLDPLAALAEANTEHLDELLREVNTGDQALAGMLADLAQEHNIVPSASELREANGEETDEPADAEQIPETYQLVVTLRDEAAQKMLYEALAAEGHDVRVLTL